MKFGRWKKRSKVENLFGAELSYAADQSILLVIGNEKVGVDPDILALADRTFALPMSGVKNSLNVPWRLALLFIRFNLDEIRSLNHTLLLRLDR